MLQRNLDQIQTLHFDFIEFSFPRNSPSTTTMREVMCEPKEIQSIQFYALTYRTKTIHKHYIKCNLMFRRRLFLQHAKLEINKNESEL